MKFTERNTRSAKLTASQVQEMRSKYAQGGYTQGRLAREYGISVIQAGRILRRESWHTLANEPSQDEIAASLARLQKELGTPPNGPALVDKMLDEANRKANPAGLQEFLDEGKKP